MDAKQYLLQIERLDRQIQGKVDEISRLNSMVTSITVTPKDVNVQISSDPDKIGAAVAKIIDLQKEANDLTDQFYDLKKEIEIQFRKLSKKEYADILYERYFKYKSIYQIAMDKEESYQKMKRVHNHALTELEKTLHTVVGEK